MLAADGGGINVDTGTLEAEAGALGSLSGEVSGVASQLGAALAAAASGIGDPGAAGAMSSVTEAWSAPLSLLGPLVGRAGRSLSSSAQVYTTTDSAVAAHIR